MMYALQEVRVQTSRPPARPVDPNEINARIEEAIQRALSRQDQGSDRQEVGQSIREAIEEVKQEIAQARAEGIREIRVEPQFEDAIPKGAVDISIAFFGAMAFIIVGLPLARAFARRMDRRGESASASEITPRLERIEQAVEAIAIEVERVSEGQRYTTRAIADLRGIPGVDNREPVRVPAGERRP